MATHLAVLFACSEAFRAPRGLLVLTRRLPPDFGLYGRGVTSQDTHGGDAPGGPFIRLLLQFERNLHSRNISSEFIVPSTSEWSTDLHGKSYTEIFLADLQDRTFYSETNRRYLQRFNISLPWHYETYMFNITVQALDTYSRLHNDLLVPQSFIVPKTSYWPLSCWNLPLGQLVFRIRNKKAFIKSFPNRKEILNEMGFIWNVDEYKQKQFRDAIHFYKLWNKHLDAPSDYTYPMSEAIPRHLWNYRFGDVCRRYTDGLVFKGIDFPELDSHVSASQQSKEVQRKRRRLIKGGSFSQFSVLGNRTLFEVVYSGLVCFKEENGHLFIPPYYVPSPSE